MSTLESTAMEMGDSAPSPDAQPVGLEEGLDQFSLSPDEPDLEAAETTSGVITPRARGSKNIEAATDGYARGHISRDEEKDRRENETPNIRLATYFVPAVGIDREVITTDIGRYLGNDALVKSGKHKNFKGEYIQGYFITAYRAPTTDNIADIKAASARWIAEKQSQRIGTRHQATSDYSQAPRRSPYGRGRDPDYYKPGHPQPYQPQPTVPRYESGYSSQPGPRLPSLSLDYERRNNLSNPGFLSSVNTPSSSIYSGQPNTNHGPYLGLSTAPSEYLTSYGTPKGGYNDDVLYDPSEVSGDGYTSDSATITLSQQPDDPY
ncbi:hypothetical protein VF21_06000 [Pseudogymnoascus sp. 05NY08]|nr:hypothetical protein VF21_06000 [Pseudogymnoascus sp. 05NY08]